MTIDADDHPCSQCGAEPGERHREIDDFTRCRFTGIQVWMCDVEMHECEPDIWDGEYPGTKECREYGLYTAVDSPWGFGPDLNTLAMRTVWDSFEEKYVLVE